MPELNEADYRDVARQFLRAVRAGRSQVALSRRLGFASNVAAEWESGRRIPYLSTALAACSKCGIDVRAAFGRFWPPARGMLGMLDARSLARWLDSQRGRETFSAVARRAGLSRHQTTRILTGETEARLHHFFALVEAITGRLSDLVAECVEIERIEKLKDRQQRVALSRKLAFEEPWTSALLSGLECVSSLSRERAEQQLAQAFDLSLGKVQSYLKALVLAGLVARRRGRYVLRDPLVVDTGSRTESALRLAKHWAEVGAERSEHPEPRDMYSYNVFSVSREDFERIAQMQREYFQKVRAIVAQSTPETVAVMNLHLLEFDLAASSRSRKR